MQIKTKINVKELMKKSVEYYTYIDETDDILSKIITRKIEPLLKEYKFDEAIKMVRDFYKPSRYINVDAEGDGDVVFIGYDIILSEINRFKHTYEKLNK